MWTVGKAICLPPPAVTKMYAGKGGCKIRLIQHSGLLGCADWQSVKRRWYQWLRNFERQFDARSYMTWIVKSKVQNAPLKIRIAFCNTGLGWGGGKNCRHLMSLLLIKFAFCNLDFPNVTVPGAFTRPLLVQDILTSTDQNDILSFWLGPYVWHQ